MAMPFGTYIAWKRRTGFFASVCACSENGVFDIASRKGRARVVPRPRRTVRRDSGFPVMWAMVSFRRRISGTRPGLLVRRLLFVGPAANRSHQECRAFDDA